MKRGGLSDTLAKALEAERRLITEPFALEKVASTLRAQCKSIADRHVFGRYAVSFHDASFDMYNLFDVFDIVGRKACGWLAQHPDLFGGEPYMVVVAKDFDINKDVCGILLQSKAVK